MWLQSKIVLPPKIHFKRFHSKLVISNVFTPNWPLQMFSPQTFEVLPTIWTSVLAGHFQTFSSLQHFVHLICFNLNIWCFNLVWCFNLIGCFNLNIWCLICPTVKPINLNIWCLIYPTVKPIKTKLLFFFLWDFSLLNLLHITCLLCLDL